MLCTTALLSEVGTKSCIARMGESQLGLCIQQHPQHTAIIQGLCNCCSSTGQEEQLSFFQCPHPSPRSSLHGICPSYNDTFPPSFSSPITISIAFLGMPQALGTQPKPDVCTHRAASPPCHLKPAHHQNSAASSPPLALGGIPTALITLLFYRISTLFLKCSKYSKARLVAPLHQTSHPDFFGEQEVAP